MIVVLAALGLAWGGPSVDARQVALAALAADLPSDRWALNTRVVQFAGGARVLAEPSLDGVPVRGATIALGVSPAGAVVRRHGHLPRVVAPPTRSVGPDPVQVAREAQRWLGQGELWPPRVTEVYFAQGDSVVAGWEVAISTARPLATWRVAIDSDGRVRDTQPTSAHTFAEVFADVFAQNPITSDVIDVELRGLLSDTSLDGELAVARSCVQTSDVDGLFGVSSCEQAGAFASPDGDGAYRYEPLLFADLDAPLQDPFAEVMVYYHLDLVARYISDNHGVTVWAPMTAYVNFPLANAFYGDFDGDGRPDVSFGVAPSGTNFAYDADVVYHEFGHGLVDRLASLPSFSADTFGMQWAGGAVNEGAADVLAMLLTGDPRIGEWAGEGLRGAPIRDVAAARACPGDLRGQVHADGEVLGAFAWWQITHPYIGRDLVRELLVGTLPFWRGQDFSWATAGETWRRTADDLHAAGALSDRGLAAVDQALDEFGLRACGRVSALELDQPQTKTILYLPLPGDFSRTVGGTQLAFTMPEGVEAVRLEAYDLVDRSEGEMGVSLVARVGEPVVMAPTVFAPLGLGLAIPDVYDLLIDGDQGGASLTVGPAGTLVVAPGETVYLALALRAVTEPRQLSFAFGEVTVAARPVPPEPTVGTLRSASCAAGAPMGSLGWLALLAPLLVRHRARR